MTASVTWLACRSIWTTGKERDVIELVAAVASTEPDSHELRVDAAAVHPHSPDRVVLRPSGACWEHVARPSACAWDEGLTRLFVHRQSGKSIKEKRAEKQAKHTDTPPLGIVPVKRK